MAVIKHETRPRKLRANDVELALTCAHGAPFTIQRWTVVPNVSWGLLPWEADLFAVSPAGWGVEIEIKVSVADLRRDTLKDKFTRYGGRCSLVRDFWYAMPEPVFEKVADAPPIPDFAGIYVVHWRGSRLVARTIRKPQRHRGARKLTDAERQQVLRLGMFRFWSQRQVELAKLESKAEEVAA